MATTINVYDQNTGLTKTVTLDIQAATIQGDVATTNGSAGFYIILSTNALTPNGNSISPIILKDSDMAGNKTLTDPINAAIKEMFRELAGLASSSESSQSNSSKSSLNSSSSSMSSLSTANSSSSSSSTLAKP